MRLLKVGLIFFVVFSFIDFLFLGLLMSDFYSSLLEPFDSELYLPGAFFAYVWLTLAPCVYIFRNMPEGKSYASLAIDGAVLGLVLYGVYDFTNLAIFTKWSWIGTIVDILWGTALYAMSVTATTWICRRLKLLSQ
jgi:uncharacterized membrane protein